MENSQADALSCHQLDHAEWSLPAHLFLEITSHFGHPLVDLFASATNHQVPRSFSRDPGAEAIDALRSPWPSGLLYAFPPFPLISRVLKKLLEEKAELILLAPRWPRRNWYADLVSLSVARPWNIPDDLIALTQGALSHPDPTWYHLTAWRLSGAS